MFSSYIKTEDFLTAMAAAAAVVAMYAMYSALKQRDVVNSRIKVIQERRKECNRVYKRQSGEKNLR